ncbi:MAG: ABC transporter transmembrane domain-containing protein [Pseudomonadota bacterium]
MLSFSNFPQSGYLKHAETLLASATIALLGLALPIALLQIYDRIIPNQSTSTIFLLVSGVAIAIFLEAIARISRAYLISKTGKKIERQYFSAAFDKLINADIAVVEARGKAEVAEQFNAINQLREHYSGQYLITVLDLVFAGIYFALIWYLAGRLVFVPLAVLLLAGLMMLIVNFSLEQSLRRQADCEEDHSNFVLSLVSAIHTIKGLALENPLLRLNATIQEKRCTEARAIDKYNALISTISQASTQIAIAAVVSIGCISVINGDLSTGGLVDD